MINYIKVVGVASLVLMALNNWKVEKKPVLSDMISILKRIGSRKLSLSSHLS